MLRIVVSKPGEAPPVLGLDLVEDPEHLKRRLKADIVAWNTEDTYTSSVSAPPSMVWFMRTQVLYCLSKRMPFCALLPFGLKVEASNTKSLLHVYLQTKSISLSFHKAFFPILSHGDGFLVVSFVQLPLYVLSFASHHDVLVMGEGSLLS